jgi:uncharacterized protein
VYPGTMSESPTTPPFFHLLAKPTGARCNLECDYCFFLKKDQLYPGSSFRMSDEVLEAHVEQTIIAHAAAGVQDVTIAWQGGEPTLMGLDFFQRAVALEKKHAPGGMRIENTLQTNGVLLDDEWCEFLRDNDFLVGLSLDGPRELHDAFRHDKRGGSVFDRVVAGARLMQKHDVQFNVLCTVNAVNSLHPLEVYRFFRDELDAHYLQFIPIVERDNEVGDQSGRSLTERSVDARQYGRFMIEIFDEWVWRDVGRTFVVFFDGVLASHVFGESSLCVLRPTCGEAMALEHTGDLYSCDHYVEPAHLLGNILEKPLADLVRSDKQREFGRAKRETLPAYCRACRWLFTCNGECPKNRVLSTPDGEEGLNWLCEGLREFFAHTDHAMQVMAGLLRDGRPADEVMGILAEGERQAAALFAAAGRNDPCPCGSGKKYKRCHGARGV